MQCSAPSWYKHYDADAVLYIGIHLMLHISRSYGTACDFDWPKLHRKMNVHTLVIREACLIIYKSNRDLNP